MIHCVRAPSRSSSKTHQPATNLSRKCRNGWLVIAMFLLVLHETGRAEGVFQVTATAEMLYVSGEATRQPLNIVERDAWESGSLPRRTAGLGSVQSPARFELAVPRFDGRRDRLYSSFQAIGIASDGKPVPLGSPRYVDVWRGVSANRDPFPAAKSKKGLQVQMLEDALALGVRHAALNLNLGQLLDVHHRPENIRWDFGGETFHFNAAFLRSMDHQVKTLSESGAVVSLILLAYQSGDSELNRVLLHPRYDNNCPNHLGAFNSVTEEGVKHFSAALEFLGHRYCATNYPQGRVANFIIGNEVNSHWFWSNRGHCTMEEFAEDYLRAVRLAHTALRKTSSSARVYLSLEHHWNIRYPGGKEGESFPAHPFIDYLHQRAVDEGDFDWHVAFHPYPENLFECRTWLDKSATTDPDTPRITFKNIELLTRYLAQSPMQYSPAPDASYSRQTRRVILSEQGFHTANEPDGELWQAAAYAYAYRKVANNPGIDAFILHRHVDHGQEGGLNLGLWTRRPGSIADPDRAKRIYEVFKQADHSDWQPAFEFALPVIGVKKWSDITP